MKFSRTELKVLSEIGKGNDKVSEIAKALRISPSQVYRIAFKLSSLLTLTRGSLKPLMKTHVSMLLKLMARAATLSAPLSGTGLQICLTIIEPKTLTQIEQETGLHRATIMKKIRQGKSISLIYPKNRTYRINEMIWRDALEFLKELKKYDEAIDPRIPVSSVIYYKKDEELVFSSMEDLDATKTAFSAYEDYGIKLLTVTNYYYLPKRKLKKTDILKHSLYIADKDKEIYTIILLALFFAKFKEEFKNMKHPILEKLRRTFNGERIDNFPTLEEIKDRAEVYNIEIR